MSKCDNCSHKEYCKLSKDMRELEKDIAKIPRMSQHTVKVECKHYSYAEHLTRT